MLVAAARLAHQLPAKVGVVSNGHWATGAADAEAWLDPLGGVISLLSLSSDAHHGSETPEPRLEFARAAEQLAPLVAGRPWSACSRCPHEDLREPGRVHVDPLGFTQICQGISLGNLFENSLREIWACHRPEADPILGPLLEGGPAELVRRHRVAHSPYAADAYQLCYEARRSLRHRFPETLAPGLVYGETAERNPSEA